ncbi:MAG: tRNA (N(6)-L-threonylcarbamoyladenosine(37)-C(2))-methylthiotransferase MtaB [Defluviitaleaceae bacterium]|nr:tRNA (N(6)-L-threonylcarbamoyladenosine(37)-C(2))-methylthiotransferase MtaB [Defluviitaleaceae bacterium]
MRESERTIAVATLGCKVNTYDTDALLTLFAEKGYTTVDFGERADIYVINTCAVTNISSRKSRKLVRRAVAANPGAVVVVAGCYAQTSPDEAAAIEGVSIVIGTGDRALIVEAVENFRYGNGVQVYKIVADGQFDEPSTGGAAAEAGHEEFMGGRFRKRAYLKVQDGCDNFCSYCIVPHARGRARSRNFAGAISEARALAAEGRKEVVVSGIHVASYGKDIGNVGLADLLQALHGINGIERLRLSSVEPTLITDEFITLMRELPKLAHHLHLSLQSGSDKILAAMNRRYTTAEYARAVAALRKAFPDIAVTTDMIVGFPGESEGDFADSLAFVESLDLSRIHVFRYSQKKGTSAAAMPNQISSTEKAARADEMSRLGEKLANKFVASQIGKVLEVLYESEVDDGIYEGYSGNYVAVRRRSDKDIRNRILPSEIVSAHGDIALTYCNN